MRVLIAGGGTGGHVFPGLVLGEALRDRLAAEILYVGTARGLESRLVPARGFALQTIAFGQLRGRALSQRLSVLLKLAPALARALGLVLRFRPHVVVGLGGYASVPIVLASAVKRLPIVLLEQNAVPGATNRLLAPLANHVVVAYACAQRRLGSRAILLGNPVRQEIFRGARAEATPTGDSCTLLVLGGSQGAGALNRQVCQAVPKLLQRYPHLRIVHQSGSADYGQLRSQYAAQPRVCVEAFLEDMPARYAEADFVLSRSGATTLAELAAAGLPAILVPYPHAADDHQAANAAEFVTAGGATMVRQESLDTRRIVEEVGRLVEDSDRRGRMAQAMRRQAHPQATSAILALLQTVARPT